MAGALKKSFVFVLLLVFGSVIAFDVGCFFILPEKFCSIFLGYRVGPVSNGAFEGGYPSQYYEAHPERGFDIGINKEPRSHHVLNYPSNYSYSIWSNSLGCFDREHTNVKQYVYLAGDSTSWGYTKFESKIGTLLEQDLKVPVLKCGVTHSGQFHQLSKMKGILESIGTPPELIVVVWSSNDVVNDAFYPHSTVINGWLVDAVYLAPDGSVQRSSPHQLQEQGRRYMIHPASWAKTVRWLLVKYSATYNVLIHTLHNSEWGQWIAGMISDSPTRGSIYALQGASNRTPVFPYVHDLLAKRNQEALIEMQKFSTDIGAPLLVVLLSLHPNHNVEVRDFLTENGIRFLDLGLSAFTFGDRKLTWRIDPHPNEEGNMVIARAIAAYIREIDLLDGEG
jgi:hypothetical protein